MRYWLSFICAVFALAANGQTVAEMEAALFAYSTSDSAERRHQAVVDRLLELDPFHANATYFKLRRQPYTGAHRNYFEQLQRRYPGRPEPISLRIWIENADGKFFINWSELALYIDFLEKGLTMPAIRNSVLLAIAQAYYADYLRPKENFGNQFLNHRYKPIAYGKWIESYFSGSDSGERFVDVSPVFEHPADSALKYFGEVWKADTARLLIYYPIRQLECLLLKDSSAVPVNVPACDTCYTFFGYYSSKITKPWSCRDSTDYLAAAMEAVQEEKRQKFFYERNREPSLTAQSLQGTDEIFRFTFQPSFHNTLILRLERHADEYQLYWKELVRPGSRGETDRLKSGVRGIAVAEYNNFKAMLAECGFEQYPPCVRVPMTDGADWQMERRTAAGFKGFQTNSPDAQFREACKYLVRLAGLQMPKGY